MTVYGINATSKDVQYGPWDGTVTSGHKSHRAPKQQIYREAAENLYKLADTYLDMAYDPRLTQEQRTAYRTTWDRLHNLAYVLECKSRGESIVGAKLPVEMVTA